MSFQAQPQQQPQQPVQVYPNTVTNEPPSHHSNGSFGTVFIVLAMIVVVSAIACFLGRLCSKKSQNQHHSGGGGQKPVKQQKQVHSVRPKDVGNGDLELGFDKRMPPAKPNGHGHGHVEIEIKWNHIRSKSNGSSFFLRGVWLGDYRGTCNGIKNQFPY